MHKQDKNKNAISSSDVRSFVLWASFSIYLYFTYHLLVSFLVLDLSLWGLAIVIPVILLLILAVPPMERRKVMVYAILFLLADKALFNLLDGGWSGWLFLTGSVLVLLVILALGRWYGKLGAAALIALTITALLTAPFMPRNELPMLSHFYPKWTSQPLYGGKTFDYFPLEVRDIDGDNQVEIITIGNVEERELEKLKTAEEDVEDALPSMEDYFLEPEPLHLYVYKWEGKQMKRLPSSAYDENDLWHILSHDDPVFPYYSADEEHSMNPQIQRQELVEGMMQFGTAPFRAMILDAQSVAAKLSGSDGAIDSVEQFADDAGFHDLQIKDGKLSGFYKEQAFQQPTAASQIVDVIRLSAGQQGVILLGNELEIVTVNEQGDAKNTHRLSADKFASLAATEFMAEDVDGDGTDELLVTANREYVRTSAEGIDYSRILKPLPDGNWDIIWSAKDGSFRFEDTVGELYRQSRQLITLDKSTMATERLRYLTAYQYVEGQLQRDWKTFVSLINVRSGDVDGDGTDELVASIYRTHRIYVFERHHLPIMGMLAGFTILLAGYGWIRRIRHATHLK